jgi:KaiC/GvpD/RAD55 family RecA-like ATPase
MDPSLGAAPAERQSPEAEPFPGALSSVPPEVRQFLAQGHSQTLLVRGASGAGKTTFALTLLKQFNSRKLFVSGRADHVRLESLFPWIATEASDLEVVEIAPIFEYPEWIHAAKDWLHIASMRQEDPKGSKQEDFSWLPPSLREVWKSLDSSRGTLIVIDSWDGLVDTYMEQPAGLVGGVPARAELERSLVRLIVRPGAHYVFVVERETEAPLDYLVDGIVSLSQPRVDGRPERWLQIPKLRGVRLDETDYPFTLQGGVFETLRPFPLSVTSVPARAEPDPNPVAGTVWPGSTAFANAFGRLPLGQLSLVEIDPGVPTEGVRLVLMPMVDAVLASGGRVLLSIPPTMNVRQFWELFEQRLSTADLIRSVRVIVTGRPANTMEDTQAVFLSLPDAMTTDSKSLQEAVEFLEKPATPGSPNAAFQWHRALKLLAQGAGIEYTPESAPRIAQQFLTSNACHLMVLGQDGDPVFSTLGDMAMLYLRFQDRRGRVLISGVRPRTPAYLLGYAPEPAPYRLMRVV